MTAGKPHSLSFRLLPPTSGQKVVALGGGHGLAATLRGMRRVTDALTAVVGVSDDGGSSGRIREQFDLIPPGDLRMALNALCGDDTWGRTWSRVLEHRFPGQGELAGHATGNLLITALWQQSGDLVAGLDWVGALLGAQGRVLPLALEPLDLHARVRGVDPQHPDEVSVLRGQATIAVTPGEVLGISFRPQDPTPCPQALTALAEADAIVMGPGSWYTSVLPHLLVEDVREAIAGSSAMRILVLNLLPQEGETSGFTADRYLRDLRETFPGFPVDRVVVDPQSVADPEPLLEQCHLLGARLVVEPVGQKDAGGQVGSVHDPDLLASVFGRILAEARGR